MKAKFGNLNFGSVEMLSRAEQNKVKGGYWTADLPNSPSVANGGAATFPMYCSCLVQNPSVVGSTKPASWRFVVPYSTCSVSMSTKGAICANNSSGYLDPGYQCAIGTAAGSC